VAAPICFAQAGKRKAEVGFHIPAGIRLMVVPAKPYIPISTLRAAVTYPAVPGAYSDDDIRRALVGAHLGDLVNELDREEVWSQRLSSGEQQRVALIVVIVSLLRQSHPPFRNDSRAPVRTMKTCCTSSMNRH
jgi:hypothetical protein